MKQVKKGDYRTRGFEKTAAISSQKKDNPDSRKTTGHDLRVRGGKGA